MNGVGVGVRVWVWNWIGELGVGYLLSFGAKRRRLGIWMAKGKREGY